LAEPPASIFERDGDAYTPTDAALSPWSDQQLHGGPPTMLLAREVERFPADQPMFVVRMTVELLRSVGRTPLAVRSRMVRPGRKVQLVEASLWNGEMEVARMTALRIRVGEVDVPVNDDAPPRRGPDGLGPLTGSWRPGGAYHTLGIEVRANMAENAAAPGWCWFRLKLPVVPGEEPTPLQRVCAAADFPNGISFVVSPLETMFVNPDLTIYVHRLPVGEWVLCDARTWLERHGTGMAEGTLYDFTGRIGRSLQGLLVERRA
jgi:hypothetical protein